MDWVQWYFAIWLALGFFLIMILHGHERSNYDVRIYIIDVLIALPWIGRIFGWW